jgi:nicotinamidase-related amidase
MKKVLIVVDMQNDFVSGPLGSREAADIVDAVAEKIEEYAANGDRVIFTFDSHPACPNYFMTREGRYLPIEHCCPGTAGWDIVTPLMHIHPEPESVHKSAFGMADWSWLAADEVEFCGVCTDICVISNALIMRSQLPEIEITVDASCCAGSSVEKHKAALEVMKSCHINVINEV